MRAEVLRRDRAADREDLAARHTLLQRRRDLVRVELLALEVTSIQALVDLHDLVEELLAVLCAARSTSPGIATGSDSFSPLGRHVRAHVEHVDDALELVLRARSGCARRRTSRRTAPGSGRARGRSRPAPVEHVHDEDARKAEVLGELLHTRRPTSKPITPETTTSAPSTTRSAQRASPWNDGSPGSRRG